MKKKWLILCGIYFILILLDGFLTYFNTPDLAFEGNPLVKIAGLGWRTLIAANVMVFFIFVIFSYFPFVKYKSISVNVKNLGEYISQIMFNRPDKLVWSLYKSPDNWAPLLAMAAYSVTYSLIIARSVIVSEWLFDTFNLNMDRYWILRRQMPLNRIDFVVFIVTYLYFIFFWFYKEYKHTKTRIY